jgi:hypothetical protein
VQVGAISGYNDGGAKTAHYGMHYVDGGSRAHPKVGILPVSCLLSAADTRRGVLAGAAAAPAAPASPPHGGCATFCAPSSDHGRVCVRVSMHGGGGAKQTGVIPYNDGGAAVHYAKLRMQNAGGSISGGHHKAGGQRSTEGIMPGSSWSEAY